jgi:hypothetical protein
MDVENNVQGDAYERGSNAVSADLEVVLWKHIETEYHDNMYRKAGAQLALRMSCVCVSYYIQNRGLCLI